MSSVQR